MQTAHRQDGDQRFHEILERIARRQVTDADVQILNSRCKRNVTPAERREFNRIEPTATPFLSAHRASVRANNLADLIRTRAAIVLIRAIHEPANARVPRQASDQLKRLARHVSTEQAGGLVETLELCIGARVRLKINLDVRNGLVNGSIGIVRYMVYNLEDVYGQDNNVRQAMPAVVVVEFENVRPQGRVDIPVDAIRDLTTQRQYRLQQLNPLHVRTQLVPITPYQTRFLVRNEHNTIRGWMTRTQIPLTLAFASTVHSVQGATLERARIDPGNSDFDSNLIYVALSRVRHLDNILLINELTRERLNKVDNLTKLRLEFERRVARLINELPESESD